MAAGISIPNEQIAAFCQRWNITHLALFGSVLRHDFGPDSDIDVLVTFSPDSRRTLSDMVTMQEELEQLFGRRVDLINRRTIERSSNYIRRREILGSARTIYVA